MNVIAEVRGLMDGAKFWDCPKCGDTCDPESPHWKINVPSRAWEHQHFGEEGSVVARKIEVPATADAAIAGLISGIKAWAADEDGQVHHGCWKQYRAALLYQEHQRLALASQVPAQPSLRIE